MDNKPTVFDPPRSRTYYFPNNEKVEIKDAIELFVSPSGTHRLKTKNKLHIVPTGWLHIEIDADEWKL